MDEKNKGQQQILRPSRSQVQEQNPRIPQVGTETTGRRACGGQWDHTLELNIDTSVCTGWGGWWFTTMLFLWLKHSRHVCMRPWMTRTQRGLQTVLWEVPRTRHTLTDGIGVNTTSRATCELMGCHIIIVVIVIHSINIITTFKQALALALRADRRDICKSKEIPDILRKINLRTGQALKRGRYASLGPAWDQVQGGGIQAVHSGRQR